jgi:ParB family chromosome partitioning protein
VGLKRPITVTRSNGNIPGKDYDLICGQGRLEAFIEAGQTEIPAIISDATEEQALVMSLVENLARKQHKPLDLLSGVEMLYKKGYKTSEISEKTGLPGSYIYSILHLINNGEERLINAVEFGHIPLTIAVKIADADDKEVQHAMHEAYVNNHLRGKKLLAAKDIIEKRKVLGKNVHIGGNPSKNLKGSPKLTGEDLLRIYQKEVDRKQMLTRKADFANNRLNFVVGALRKLLKEDNFNTLLKAEGLNTIPKQLAELIGKK